MRLFLTYLAGITLFLGVFFRYSGNEHMFKALHYTYFSGHTGPTIDDYKIFENRIVHSNRHHVLDDAWNKGTYEIDTTIYKLILDYDPAALLVIYDDRIVHEEYWDDYDDASYMNSFSVAKSIVGLATLRAIELGYLDGLDQKVIDFVPELEGEYREDVTIRHLLSMTSGIDFDESYINPLGFMARAYYGDSLYDETMKYEAEDEPGSYWKYLGGNTILLSFIVSRASKMTLSDFVAEHVWARCGAGLDALWSIDHPGGLEKAYCCFHTNVRDFARLGYFVHQDGRAFHKQLLSKELLAELKKPVVLNNGDTIEHYGLQWWRIQYNNCDITYARGILGQYIISIPEYDMIVCRLGHKRGKKDEFQHPEDLYLYIEFARSLWEQEQITLDDGSPEF